MNKAKITLHITVKLKYKISLFLIRMVLLFSQEKAERMLENLERKFKADFEKYVKVRQE